MMVGNPEVDHWVAPPRERMVEGGDGRTVAAFFKLDSADIGTDVNGWPRRFLLESVLAVDLYLFNEGTHVRIYQKLGAHVTTERGEPGVAFAVWAPTADAVSVIGDFNAWDPDATPLHPRASSGIWEGFVPGITKGGTYKYFITSRFHGYQVEKADPFGAFHEVHADIAMAQAVGRARMAFAIELEL